MEKDNQIAEMSKPIECVYRVHMAAWCNRFDLRNKAWMNNYIHTKVYG